MAHETWRDYLARISTGASGVELARTLGVSEAKVSYWRSGARTPSPREAADAARAYGRPGLEGLLVAGYIREEDLEGRVEVVARGLGDYSDVEIANEMLRRARLAVATRGGGGDDPDELLGVALAEPDAITGSRDGVVDLSRRRTEREIEKNQGADV